MNFLGLEQSLPLPLPTPLHNIKAEPILSPESKSKNRKGAKEIWRRKKQLDVELGNLMKKITALKQSMILPDDDNAAIEMLISQLNRLQPAIDRLIESLASENQREELSTRRLLTELSTRENKKADALRDLQKLLQDRDKCLEELSKLHACSY